MERLTCNKLNKLTAGCYFVNLASKEESTKYRMLAESAPKYEELYRKLANYEDAEEQGLLLKLPCKVGDTVYFIYHDAVHHEEVKRFFQCNGGTNWGIVLWGMYPDLYFDQIGKTVFLTKEEAEQALKQIGGVK